MGLIDDIKHKYQNGNLAIRLIFINVAIFLFVAIGNGIFKSIDFVGLLGLSSDVTDNFTKPWAIFTYMFLHVRPWHLIFNMIMLYAIGQFFYRYFNDKAFAQFYFLGGIFGGILYLLFNLISPSYSILMGASAAIYSVLFAMVAYQPDLRVRLMFVQEPVKLMYVAIGFIALGFFFNADNLGGNISHVGGALFGYLYMKQFEKGKSWFEGISFKNPFKGTKSKLKAKKNTDYQKPPKDDYEYADWKKKKEDNTNTILEKISRSGYNSLTKEEKEFLFKQGKK